MGQKVNPIGFRLAVNRNWRSIWYADKKNFPIYVVEDFKIRRFVKKKLETAAVSKIVIERAGNRVRVNIHTARPGLVIGRKAAELDKLKEEIRGFTNMNREILIDVKEVKNPETDAQLVAENIAQQIERRISHRRAMKKSVQTDHGYGSLGDPCALRRTSGRFRRSPGWNVIWKEKFRCILCVRTLITDLPRPKLWRARSV